MTDPLSAEQQHLAAIERGESTAHVDLADLYEELGRYDEAERHYLAAITQRDGEPR